MKWDISALNEKLKDQTNHSKQIPKKIIIIIIIFKLDGCLIAWLECCAQCAVGFEEPQEKEHTLFIHCIMLSRLEAPREDPLLENNSKSNGKDHGSNG